MAVPVKHKINSYFLMTNSMIKSYPNRGGEDILLPTFRYISVDTKEVIHISLNLNMDDHPHSSTAVRIKH